MRMKRRPGADLKPTPLPPDYLRMVVEAFGDHFGEILTLLEKRGEPLRFVAEGALFPDEVLLSVSLVSAERLAATTVHASCDFELSQGPAAVEPLLALSVDAVGSLFAELLSAKAAHPPAAGVRDLGNFPISWSPAQVEGRTVYLLVDATNPELEKMADDLLADEDPDEER